jgi:hypothetical protein
MGNKAIIKEARRAAREAAAAAQEEPARRTRANVEDLAAFFSARERADAVDEWLSDRQRVLREQAEQRRGEQRVQCGRALRSMRDRGERLREIARMAGVTDKTVRELIREAEAAAEPGMAPQSGAEGGPDQFDNPLVVGRASASRSTMSARPKLWITFAEGTPATGWRSLCASCRYDTVEPSRLRPHRRWRDRRPGRGGLPGRRRTHAREQDQGLRVARCHRWSVKLLPPEKLAR